jgi:hypothetical protein
MRGYPSASPEHMFDSSPRKGVNACIASVPQHMFTVPSSPPSGGGWRLFEAALGVAAAAPSVVGALLGAPLLLDDWSYAAKSRLLGFASAYGTQTRSRPIEGLWNWGEFRLLGTHTVPHLLVLAALNVAAAILFWRLLAHWVPRRVAVLAALAWVALPNRGSTHLWSTNSPHMFSLVMLLTALLVASERPLGAARIGVALSALVVGTLAYEGGVAIGAVGLAIMIWTGAPRGARVRWAVLAVTALVAVAGWVLLSSPKRSGLAPVFRNLSHLASAHFGAAVLPPPSRVLAIVVLLAIVWCVVTVLLPGFNALPEQNLVVIGLLVIVLGALPFTFAGFPFSTSGFFDRGNAFSDLGTALVYGSLVALVLRLRSRAAAYTMAGFAIAALAVPNARSVHNYVRTGQDGRRFLAAVDALPAQVRTRGPVTFAPLPSYGAVSEFLSTYDISSALALRYRLVDRFPRAGMAASAAAFRSALGVKYELVGDKLVERSSDGR